MNKQTNTAPMGETSKPFAFFVQPSGFGPYIECEPTQAGCFPAYRTPTIPSPVDQDAKAEQLRDKIRDDIGPEDFGVPAEYAERARLYANWLTFTPAAPEGKTEASELTARLHKLGDEAHVAISTANSERLKSVHLGKREAYHHAATLAARSPVAAPDSPAAKKAGGLFPERDQSKPAEQQGLFRKFAVYRADGSSQPGGKHHGCRYYVLDLTHDQHAPAAMRAYAAACRATHPQLADDIEREYGNSPAAADAGGLSDTYPEPIKAAYEHLVATAKYPMATALLDSIARLLHDTRRAAMGAAGQPDFAAIDGKRMSELTPAQREDARELWLRNQYQWFGMADHEAGTHIKFLLDRLDAARPTASSGAFDEFDRLRKIPKTPGYCDGPMHTEREAFELAARPTASGAGDRAPAPDAEAIAQLVEQVRSAALEEAAVFYMRDNHTFKKLHPDVNVAVEEIDHELNEGFTSGMLCTKRNGAAPPLHFSFFTPRNQMLSLAREWLTIERKSRALSQPSPAVKNTK